MAGRTGPIKGATVVTDEMRARVIDLAAAGLTLEQIAVAVGVHVATLKRRCQSDITRAYHEATAKVGKRLFQLAMEGNVAACIFWMKARAKWSEKVEHQVDVTTRTVVDLGKVREKLTQRLIEARTVTGEADDASAG